MRRLRAAWLRLVGLVSRAQRERAFADELESHLQLHIDDNLRAGMSPEAARRHAILKLGGIAATTRDWRERSSIPLLEHLVQDVRFAARQLARRPAFTSTAVITLALGIGASVAIFGFVDASLIRPLPYPRADRLVDVTEATPQIPRAALSWPDFQDWKRLNTVFNAFDLHAGRGYMMRTSTGTELVPGARVSDGFFRTLGVTPFLGRDFRDGEDRAGVPDTVILTYGAWQRRFGGRREVIGQTITLNALPHTIVGVLPPEFQFALRGRAELWTPFHPAANTCDTRRSCHAFVGVARLKDGVSVDAALAEMKTIARQLEQQYPDSNRDQGATVAPLAEVMVATARPVLLVLLAGAGLLLAIAAVNVASLMLVRSEGRRRELAVRSALGASHGRLLRQFAAESLVLVGASTVIGVAAARVAAPLLVRLIPVDMRSTLPFLQHADLGPHTMAFIVAVAVAATILLALTPAVRLSVAEMREGMAEGSRGSSGNAWRRIGHKLVVVELATAMVLLVGAGLLGKSLYRLMAVDLGFEPERLATLQVAAPPSAYETNARAVALAERIVSRVERLPGVRSVAHTSVLPVSFNGNTDWIRFVGRPYNGEHNEVNQRDVSAGYFETIGARLVRGRFLTKADTASSPKVVVINEALARRYFEGQDPIGQQFGDMNLSPDSIKEIVGVVADVREGTLESDIWPAAYYPFTQSPFPAFSLVVRTTQPEDTLLATLAAAVREVDGDIGTIAGVGMTERINDSTVAYVRRSSTWLVGSVAALALLLGIVGLYGVVAYSVSQRTREIGVRLAMGADRRSVSRLVLREAGRLAGMGLVLGLVASIAAASLMRKLLFGTPPWDAPTLVAVAIVLAVSALVASYVPARRAASVDPIEALRVE